MKEPNRRLAVQAMALAITGAMSGCGGNTSAEEPSPTAGPASPPPPAPPLHPPPPPPQPANKAAWPSWRRSTSVATWTIVPATSRLATLDPKLNPEINPNYPDSPEWAPGYGMPRVFNAWNGGCYDQDADVFWAPLQGGHTDYGGNEPYKLELSVERPQWVMLRPPSGAVGNVLTTRDGQEASGVYADGRPRSIHSYNRVVYVPGSGPWVSVHGPTWYTAGNGKTWPIRIDPTTGEATLGLAENQNLLKSNGGTNWLSISGGGACYDSRRHCIWFRGQGTAYIHRYDIANDVWSQVGPNLPAGAYAGICHQPWYDLILYLSGSNGSGSFLIFDPVSGEYHRPPVTGTTMGPGPTGQAQPWWIDSLGVLAWWDNATETSVISTLSPPVSGDWRTGTWQLGMLEPAIGNTVIPTRRNSNGTYGRFAYSPNLRGFMLLNGAEDDVFFFSIE